MAYLFSRIAREGMLRGHIPGYDEDSRDWFRDRAQAVVKMNPKRIMMRREQKSIIEPGKMYMFFYDPKHKDKLPYYDTFPLLFPFSMTGTHFTGLEMM